MGENLGKKFEKQIREGFERVPNVSVDRIPDQVTGYVGSANICDFIVYRKPYQVFIECKSHYGNTISIYSKPKKNKLGILHGFYGDITDTQWEGLLEKAKIPGVFAGLIIWFIDHDLTVYVPISVAKKIRDSGAKSINIKDITTYKDEVYVLKCNKRRILFDYEMESFLDNFN